MESWVRTLTWARRNRQCVGVEIKKWHLIPRSEIAGAESEFERQFGKVASLRKRGVLVENDLVRRAITATGAIKLRSSFSH